MSQDNLRIGRAGGGGVSIKGKASDVGRMPAYDLQTGVRSRGPHTKRTIIGG